MAARVVVTSHAMHSITIQYNTIGCWQQVSGGHEHVVDRQRESHGLDGMMGISQSVVGFP